MTTLAQTNGFYLYTSNRTERLLDCLAAFIDFKNSSGRNIFEKETFLIQSQGMERMISQAMSSHFGSWCNYSYYSPVKFLQLVAGHLDLEQTSQGYEREHLIWWFDLLLSSLDDPSLASVQAYINGENGSLKRFQLARQLANIFDQYQLMRPDMLEKWTSGERLYTSDAEIWQQLLWNALQTELAPQQHRGSLVLDINEALKSGETFPDLSRDVYIFGLHIMAPLFLQCLQSLSSHVRVHLFLLSPCREYWGDMETKRQSIRRAMAAVNPDDLLVLSNDEYHPLLRAYGQQGRIFQEMLLESVEFAGEVEAYTDEECDTLLHTLQQELLDNRVDHKQQSTPMAMDGSVEIISCHSRFREIMVLRDHILHQLNNNPGLKLREIVVMAPDIQEYVPFIEAVFHDIHHSIADRSSRKRNEVFAAFSSFLHLFSGRFGWNEVLELLKLPVIHPQFDLSLTDLENLQRWIVDSGIRWGLSASQRSDDLDLPDFGENSWQTGLDRILLGYAMQGNYTFQGVSPYQDIEGGSARAVGGLIEFIEIISTLREQLKTPKSVSQWVDLFLTACDDLFGQQDSRDLLELRSILTELKETAQIHSSSPVEFAIMLDWFDHAAKEARTSSGFLRGQITFCSMLPMRSIPFKVVCLIGLNDGEFPKKDQFATFDLMGVEQRRGDRSSRNDDRYQFLEAILAARKTLYLSYVGQSIKTNEQIPPSVVVTELIEVLQQYYGVDEPVTHHPLQPFSHRYFDGGNQNLFSYDDDYCRVAQSLQGENTKQTQWWQGKLACEEKEIRFEDLLRFFSNPQRWFVRNRLGIDLQLEDSAPDENERFSLDPLTKYQINHTLISGLQAKEAPADLLQPFRVSGNWFVSVPGEIEAVKTAKSVERYITQIGKLGLGDPCEPVTFSCEVGATTLSGTLDGLYERGLVLIRFGKCRGADVLRAWLHFLVVQKVLNKVLPVYLLCQENSYVLQAGHEAELMQLDEAVECFWQGSEQPFPLYVEPAFEYIKQRYGRGTILPMQKALTKLDDELNKGYQPELELLLEGLGPEDVLNDEFEQLVDEILDPVWRAFIGK